MQQQSDQNLLRIDVTGTQNSTAVASLIAQTLAERLPGQNVQILSPDQDAKTQSSLESFANGNQQEFTQQLDGLKLDRIVVSSRQGQFQDPSTDGQARIFNVQGQGNTMSKPNHQAPTGQLGSGSPQSNSR